MAQEWAGAVKQEFTYPVDSIVLSSAGAALSQGEFQEMYSPVNPLAYLQMLEKAVPPKGDQREGANGAPGEQSDGPRY